MRLGDILREAPEEKGLGEEFEEIGEVQATQVPTQVPESVTVKAEPEAKNGTDEGKQNLEDVMEERPEVDVERILIENTKAVICTGSDLFLGTYKRLVEQNRDALMKYKEFIEQCYLIGKVLVVLWDGKFYEVGLKNGEELQLPRCEVTRGLEVKYVPIGKIGSLFKESVETTEYEQKFFTPEEQDMVRAEVTLGYLLPKKSERVWYMLSAFPPSSSWKELEKERAVEKTQLIDRKINEERRKRKSFAD